jgi:hypothetical protein
MRIFLYYNFIKQLMKTITILAIIAIVSAVGMIMSSGIVVSTVNADPAVGKGNNPACAELKGQEKADCVKSIDTPPGQEKKSPPAE